jgi:anti-sigma factor RsiW
MECSEPGIISDEELLAFLDGEHVRPVVQQHLAQCLRCSAQLAEYRELEQSLMQKLYRWDCPPNQILGEYHLGMLNSETTSAVQKHLSQCVLCADEVASLTEFLASDPMLVERAAMQTSSLKNHRTTKQALKGLLEDLREQSREQVRRIAAILVPQQPRYAFQRNVAASTWPRSYTAEDFTISIQVERGSSRDETVQMIGFVIRKGTDLESLSGVPVQLVSSNGASLVQQIDELGNFVFSSIAPATYSLELQLPESTIVIEQLPVEVQE